MNLLDLVCKISIDDTDYRSGVKNASDSFTKLKSGIGTVVKAASGIGAVVTTTIKGWFTGKDGFDEHSPSKWSKQVFRYVMEGSVEGLDAGLPGLMRSVGSVTDRVKSGLDFGTASVDFASSGIGTMRKYAVSDVANSASIDRPIYTEVTLKLDSHTLARQLFGPLRAEERRIGTQFVY